MFQIGGPTLIQLEKASFPPRTLYLRYTSTKNNVTVYCTRYLLPEWVYYHPDDKLSIQYKVCNVHYSDEQRTRCLRAVFMVGKFYTDGFIPYEFIECENPPINPIKYSYNERHACITHNTLPEINLSEAFPENPYSYED